MPKFHLTLIGAQALPVYNGILYQPADKVLLFHSKDTEQIALNIQAVLKCDAMLVPIENPFDYKECKEKIEVLVNHSETTDWTFNISGGSKIMTIAALDVARERKIPAFFIDQNNKVTDLQSFNQSIFETPIDLQVYFRLFGQSAKSTIRSTAIDIQYFKLTKLILANIFKFLPLFSEYRKKKYEAAKDFMIKNKHFELVWDAKANEAMVYEESTRTESHIGGSLIFDVLFNTGWFELLVIDMLKDWAPAKQIYWHTVLPRTTNGDDKNEIDIIADTGIKLFFIECKTTVYEVLDIDKFRNVVKNFGGLSAKPLLVNYFKPNEKILEKCHDNKIPVFWFFDAELQEKTSLKQFYQLLDVELNKVNPV
jgi:hypothetical protein